MARPRTDAEPRPAWANRIAELRRKAGLSQAELAALIGVGQSSVNDWESGRNLPRTNNLRRLGDVLNVPLRHISPFTFDELLEGDAEISTPAPHDLAKDDIFARFGAFLAHAALRLKANRGRDVPLEVLGSWARRAWVAAGGSDEIAPDGPQLEAATNVIIMAIQRFEEEKNR